MNLNDVKKEIADLVDDAIPGLNVFSFNVKKVPVPGACVGIPERVEYDQTYGRGSDAYQVPLLVLIGDVSASASDRALNDYLSGGGARSIPAAFRNHAWTACDDVHVRAAEPGTFTSGGVILLGVEFTLVILGKGETS